MSYYLIQVLLQILRVLNHIFGDNFIFKIPVRHLFNQFDAKGICRAYALDFTQIITFCFKNPLQGLELL